VSIKEKMRAAVLEGVNRLEVRMIEKPQVKDADDVLLKVNLCSICGTDVHILNGTFQANVGIALGHEIIGTVEKTGYGVTKFRKGDRLIIEPNIYCGKCHYCLIDMNNQCENMVSVGVHINGGFAEYCMVKERVCHKVNDRLPEEAAVFAEPLACVLGGIKKIRPMTGESALLIGAGPIALMYLQLLKANGVKPLIVSEIKEERRRKAMELGADYSINPVEEDLETFVKGIVPYGVDYAIDAVGSQSGAACKAVRKKGKVLLFGLDMKAELKIPQRLITLNEINIMGTYIDDATFPLSVQILENNMIDVKAVTSHILPLDQIHEGIELMKKGESLKVLVKP
jgi:threonine dehydrogenase-like Zn-dependent dehydrogenase